MRPPWFALSLALTGCAATIEPQHLDVPPGALAPPTRTSSSLPAPRPSIDEIVPPDGVACRYVGNSRLYPKGSTIRLCAANGGSCFFEMAEGRLADGQDIVIGTGSPASVFVEIVYERMRVRGFVDAPGIHLWSTQLRPLAGFALPERLTLERATREELEVVADLGEPFSPREARAKVACDEVRFESSWRTPAELAQLGGGAGKEEVTVLPRSTVQVFSSATSPTPEFHVDASKEGVITYAFQTEQARRFVLVDAGNGSAFGWVDKKLLSTPRSGAGFAGSSGGGRVFIATPDPTPAITCPRDVAVIAKTGSARLDIGRFPRGAPFTVREPLEYEYVDLVLRHPHAYPSEDPLAIQPFPGARLLPGVSLAVRRADLDGCEPFDPSRIR